MEEIIDINNIKVEPSYTVVEWKNMEIKVLTYLSIRDKYDLIMIALQKAEENGFYNPVKIQLYMNLYIFNMYTADTLISNTDDLDDFEVYDRLERSGLLDLVLCAIPEKEYSMLKDMFYTTLDAKKEYNQSVVSLMQKVIEDMPKNAEAAAQIVNNFNPEQYKAVLNLASNSGMRNNG